MLLVAQTPWLCGLLPQILATTHLSLERKTTVTKTLYHQDAAIFTEVNMVTQRGANTHGHSNTKL